MNTLRILTPVEWGSYRDHLLRLSVADRRMRFSGIIDDAAIASFVTGISPWNAAIIARFNQQLAITAAVHIAVVGGSMAEFGLTVDEAERGQGLGIALMNRALLWARNRNIERACIHFQAENQAMHRTARHTGMAVSSLHGESEGYCDLPRATVLSIAREIHAEQAGVLDYLLKAGRRPLALASPSPAPRLQPQL